MYKIQGRSAIITTKRKNLMPWILHIITYIMKHPLIRDETFKE